MPILESLITKPDSRPDVVDVVRNFEWSISPHSKRQEDIPFIILDEFIQIESALAASASFWINHLSDALTFESSEALATNVAQGTERDFYKGLYAAVRTGRTYILPWFSEYNHTINNSWGENRGYIESGVESTIVALRKNLYASVGIEPPRVWHGANNASYSFQFYLLNTVKSAGKETWRKNREVIDKLIRSNLQSRTSVTTLIPPSIYEVVIPGVRFSPAAAITSLQITNIGQLNRFDVNTSPEFASFNTDGEFVFDENISEGKNKLAEASKQTSPIIVPDAWLVTIEITELINESSEIYKNRFALPDNLTAIVSATRFKGVDAETIKAAGRAVLSQLGRKLTSNE